MIPAIAEIVTMFRLPSKVGADVLTGPAHAARETLRDFIGTEALEEAEADTASASATEVIKLAGKNFAMYYAAPAIAARIRSDGQVITESSETARVFRYATAEETEAWRAQLWRDALGILKVIPGLLQIPTEDAPVSGQRDWQLTPSQPVDARFVSYVGQRLMS